MYKEIEVFTSAHSFREEDVENKIAVVIDVLRASSTIVTAIHNEAAGMVPVKDLDEGSKVAQNLDPAGYLLCGEKNGVKIEGYHLGNSPLEYTTEKVGSKTLIFKTSNGTQAIARARYAKEIYIGSFLNKSRVIEELRKKDRGIVLICAGWKGRLSLEDMLCAGQIVYELFGGKLPQDANDGAKVAFSLYEKFGSDIEEVIKNSNHALRLNEIVNMEDITYSCQVDLYQTLPVLNERMITRHYEPNKKTS